MEKIIKGKRYNTATAEAVAVHEYLYPSQFEWVHEILYRKRTGEFFLWGEGGANTRYRKRVERNVFGAGEKIKPLTLDEAKKFVEEYGTAENYKKLFEIDEWDDENAVLNIQLPNPTFQRLKRVSVGQGKSMTQVVVELIDKNCKEE